MSSQPLPPASALASTSAVPVKIKTLSHFCGDLPAYESLHASGADIRAVLSKEIVLSSLERALIPTGLIFEIPKGFEIQVRPRSGLAVKKGLTLINSPGTIDADYRGELKIIVINLSKEDIIIQHGQRIAQIVLCPIVQAKWERAVKLNQTARGKGGFGSTGVS